MVQRIDSSTADRRSRLVRLLAEAYCARMQRQNAVNTKAGEVSQTSLSLSVSQRIESSVPTDEAMRAVR